MYQFKEQQFHNSIIKNNKMKKVYDWNIQLSIHIENNNKNIIIVCSVHTTIHALKIQICKKLGLLVFDTQIDLYGGRDAWRPMKPTSSLQQNGIEKSHTVIRAKIKRIKQNLPLDITVEDNIKTNKKQKQGRMNQQDSAYGLNIQATCTYSACVNYQQNVLINFGFGTFPLFRLISDLKCDICPYKSQHLRPSMMCKSLRVQKCLYKIEGTIPDRDGLPLDKSTGFIRALENKDIKKQAFSEKWNGDVMIVIKHL